MFKVHINNEESELPQDDIYYIVAKEGIFIKKKLGIMESISPVKNISILKSISSSARMHIEKIPGVTFAKIIDFFKKVYDKHGSEAVVLLFYKEDIKKYRIVPPHQKVSGASVEYNRGISLEGWTMIGTIHSHASMSAFHSGVDDSDEDSFDGLHITIGNVNSENFSISASIVSNGFRTKVEPEDYIDGIKQVAEPVRSHVTYSYKWKDGKMQLVEEEKPSYPVYTYKWKDGKMQLEQKNIEKSKIETFTNRYTCLVPPSKSECNPKWLDVVEKKVYARPTFDQYSQFDYGYGYGKHYDPYAWSRFRETNKTPNTTKDLHKFNQMIIDKLSEGEKEEDDDFPCLKCKYRNDKILLEEDEDEFYEVKYLCTKCDKDYKESDLIDISPDGEIRCPNCKTDKYLSVLEEDVDTSKLESKFEPISNSDREERFHTCKTCKSTFLKYDGDVTCPICNGDLNTSKQSEEVQIGRQNVERITLPGSNVIPITEKSDNILKNMIKKVFGKDRLF